MGKNRTLISAEDYFDLTKDFDPADYVSNVDLISKNYEMINYEPVREDQMIYRIYYELGDDVYGQKYINNIPESCFFDGIGYAG